MGNAGMIPTTNYPRPSRHTFASLLFASGASIKMVSELMGHSSTAITANIYVHIIQKYKAQTANKVEEFLS